MKTKVDMPTLLASLTMEERGILVQRFDAEVKPKKPKSLFNSYPKPPLSKVLIVEKSHYLGDSTFAEPVRVKCPLPPESYYCGLCGGYLSTAEEVEKHSVVDGEHWSFFGADPTQNIRKAKVAKQVKKSTFSKGEMTALANALEAAGLSLEDLKAVS